MSTTDDLPRDVRIACRVCGRYVLVEGATASTAAGLRVVCAECVDEQDAT
jgi:hypothetical protein